MNDKVNIYSKEAIKARMLQNAVKIWGLKSASSIDPFVKLLIDAFSAEMFRVNNEIQTVNSRILEKLAKLLTPTVYTYPQPAHAIGVTLPFEDIEILPNYSEFFIQKQFSSSAKNTTDVQIDIAFTPIGNIPLSNLFVSIIFIGQVCYIIDEEYNKIPIAKTPTNTLAHNKIILGIDATAYENEFLPNKLHLYCPNSNYEHLNMVYKLLPFVTVRNQNTVLNVSSGISYVENEQTEVGFGQLIEELSISKKVENNIKNLYRDKFIELSGFDSVHVENEFPTELLGSFEHLFGVQEFVSGKKIIWLEIEFPPQFSLEILENFSFILNAFPIYNRGWRSSESTLDIMGNNIPLHTQVGEHFLYVDNVIDGAGNEYEEVPISQTSELKKGLFTVRNGGMERFSDRNAIDLITNVIELTRDEISAFGILERDKVAKALKNMTQQMKMLEQKVNAVNKDIIQNINYVIVDLISDIEHLKADYWVTHCELANNLRAGSKLIMQKRTQSSIFRNLNLLTDSRGGNDEKNGSNAIQAYKYALTTRDKIITVEDVKNFCKYVIKGDLKNISVKRGIAISDKPKEGFIRTIEIEITPYNYQSYTTIYWDTYAKELKRQIEMRAIDGIEYVLKFTNGDEEYV